LANENRFYRTKKINKDFVCTITKELDKDEFCRWICEERNEIEDFRNFNVIIEIIDRILSKDV